MSVVEQSSPGFTGRQAWVLFWVLVAALVAWLFLAVWPSWLDAVLISKKAFVSSIFNGVTLAGLYFLVASGFTLVFGLMRNVNLAHGSLYLLGAYIDYEVSERTGIWLLGVGAGFVAMALVGLLMQVFVFRRLEGDELRQTLVTLGISVVAADLMLAIWTGITYQIGVPAWLDGAVKLPIVTAVRSNGTAVLMTYPFYRLVVLAAAIVIGVGLWLMISGTRIGMMIRAGVDDRPMLSASGINVHVVFAVVFAVGAGLAGFAGVVGGSALSLAPGEDVRYLLASLVVVIVGGMGSIPGAAIGALLVGLAEQIGLVYSPTYGIVLTFIIMVVTLAIRPQGIMGTARTASVSPVLALDQPNRAVDVPAQFGLAQIVLAMVLVLYPVLASEFFLTQIGAYSLIWGLLALSMMLLAGYGGMVSLAQITTAGVAAYTVAIFGTNNMNIYGFGWPWWVLVPFAVLLAGVVSAIIGAISVRTDGIYTIMITLAIAAAFFYFAQQNYALFNGHSGYAGIPAPRFWGIDWRDPVPFYYLCLFVAGACYAAVLYCSRSTFGLALQAIRDNSRRMRAVGFDVTAHKITAYFYSGLIAGLAGVLLVWFNGRVSPGTVNVGQAIEVLIIAVIGGLRHPIGAFLGAVFVIFIQTFAIDIVGAERYNTLIGLVFLAIVFVSPDGLLGLWGRIKPLLAQQSVLSRVSREAELRAETQSNQGRIE
jgi:branched-chain amino acid transport system permease protein